MVPQHHTRLSAGTPAGIHIEPLKGTLLHIPEGAGLNFFGSPRGTTLLQSSL